MTGSLSAQPVPTQTSLPVTTPTALAPAPEASVGLDRPGPKPAEISYTGGKLEIAAENSSLNQILREIQRKTGMTITGGVAEERVFGKYGPGTLAEVLTALLDGTGSNMLLVGPDQNGTAQAGASQTSMAELILTPRQGGTSPPSPSAFVAEEPVRRPEPAAQPAFQPALQPIHGMPPQALPATAPDGTFAATPSPDPSLPSPQFVPSPAGTTVDPSDSNNPQSPNGVKTPQQIYQQLIRMQQLQQLQQQANPK